MKTNSKRQTDTYPKQEDELSYEEFKERYNAWIPKDTIPFEELLNKVIEGEGFLAIRAYEGNLIAYFTEIFNKIPKGSDRKKALSVFLGELNSFRFKILNRDAQKRGRYLGYNKNDKQKIKGNISSAKKVLESLVHEGMREGTQTFQLSNLLQIYISQSEKMLNTRERIIEPLEIKDYRLYDKISGKKLSKKSIEKCLRKIIEDFNLKIDNRTIRFAIESL